MDNKIFKIAKFIKNMGNNEDLEKRSESAIRNHVIWSMGAGFIPVPIADFVAVAAIQLDMVRTLSGIYGVNFKETEGKALVTSITGSGLSRLGANALVKLIPGFGSMLGGISMSVISGASTYALGQVFKKHFSVGGTFLDFDTERFQRYYNEQFEKGKDIAEEIQKEKDEKGAVQEEANPEQNSDQKTIADDEDSLIIKKLKELAELKELGVIDDKEFATMKKRLIDRNK